MMDYSKFHLRKNPFDFSRDIVRNNFAHDKNIVLNDAKLTGWKFGSFYDPLDATNLRLQ